MPKQFNHVQFGNTCPSIIQRPKCVLKNFKLFSPSFQSQPGVLCTHVHTYTPVFWGKEFFQHNRHSKFLILSLILKEVDSMVKQSWLTAYGNMALALVKGVMSTYWEEFTHRSSAFLEIWVPANFRRPKLNLQDWSCTWHSFLIFCCSDGSY